MHGSLFGNGTGTKKWEFRLVEHIRYGDGPIRAIFMHGWFGDANDFGAVLAAVDPERFSIASLEFRGYCAARDSDGPFTIEAIATDALTLADELGWERFAVVGHSMGGKAALRVATMAADRVERLCGIAPVWAGRSPFDEARLAMLRKAPGDVAVRQAVIHGSTGARLPKFWSRNLAERCGSIAQAQAIGDYFESWALDDFSAAVDGLETETLVIVGAHDPGLSEATMKSTWLARLPHVRMIVMPDAGHYPIAEAPLALAAHVTSFLDGAG